MNEQLPKSQEPTSAPQQETTQFYKPAGQKPQEEQVQGGSPSSYEGYDLAAEPEHHAARRRNASIIWEASEYVHHDKGAGWIIGLIVVAVALVGLAIWMQVWTFALLIVVMAVAIGVFAFRPPHVLHYMLSDEGLKIGDKFYSFADFRAFGILSDGAFYTIMLLPTKRFMPAVNVYFAEEDGEKIVDILGERLPMETIELDAVERLMRRLRF